MYTINYKKDSNDFKVELINLTDTITEEYYIFFSLFLLFLFFRTLSSSFAFLSGESLSPPHTLPSTSAVF